jgi:hypothetical protein
MFFSAPGHARAILSVFLAFSILCVNFINIYMYIIINKAFIYFRSFALPDQHGGHGQEVVLVLHVVPHAKDILEQADLGKKGNR